jgi:dTDP-4-dehydrorhamnose reductase
MPYSFTLQKHLVTPPTPGKLRVLVTGAAGNIGSAFAEHGQDKYDLRLMIRPGPRDENEKSIDAFGEVVEADLTDVRRLKEVCSGVDTVVHLAGDPSPNATWQSLLPANIVGTYNVMAAAKSAGVRLVVHASSIHAVGGAGSSRQSHTGEPPNPGDLYGVTKCFGEALGAYMAAHEGLSVISLRIGAFQPQSALENKDAVSIADSWISPRDMNQMFDRCIAARQVRWGVFNALSANAFNRLDISDAREVLGYEPVDDAFKVVPGLEAYDFAGKLMKHNLKDGFAKSGMREDV